MKTRIKYEQREVEKEVETMNIMKSAEEYYQKYRKEIERLSKQYNVDVSKKDFIQIALYSYAYEFGELIIDRVLEVLEQAMKIAKSEKTRMLYPSTIIKVFKDDITKFKKMRDMHYKEIEVTSYHEAGHFIVNKEFELHDNILYVSIIPGRNFQGINIWTDENDGTYTREDYIRIIAMCLAGNIANELYQGMGNNGVIGDLQAASWTARDMVLSYGMRRKTKNLGKYSSMLLDNEIDYSILSNEQKNELERETNRILKESRKLAIKILKKRKRQLKIIVEALIERGALTGEQANKLYSGELTLKDLPPAKIRFIT